VRHLPELIVAAGGRLPVGVMIARGDLAVEVGFERLAELQEEILWLAEAAHTPVIWATQVLDRLVRKGTPSRAEISDVVLAQRAECVMLNKGEFLLEAVSIVDEVCRRMDGHQHKKTSRLRALHAWS
jgi:pyruvate kinase